ncbi:MAG: NAD-dependent epimerase/dehydratase family protein, partial [Nitrospira sp.]
MKALVTGATGFVGAAVARAVAATGADVRVMVRQDSERGNLDGLPAEHVQGDLRNPDSL